HLGQPARRAGRVGQEETGRGGQDVPRRRQTARRRLVRVVSVHTDALVAPSPMWQTNAGAVREGGEAMLIDSPYFPDELDALPGVLAQAGFEVDALLATH